MTRIAVALFALTAAACTADAPRSSQEALDANEARLRERLTEIEAVFEARTNAATTDAERRAAVEWQRAEYTKAVNEYNAEALRIFRRKAVNTAPPTLNPRTG